MRYAFDVKLTRGEDEVVMSLPRYALEPIFWEVALLSGGRGEVEIVPLYPPEAFNDGRLYRMPISALLGRNEIMEVRLTYSLESDALLGAITDMIYNRFHDAHAGALVHYSIYSKPDVGEHKLHCEPLEERSLSELDLRLPSKLPVGIIPKVLSWKTWRKLVTHALSDTTRERIGALRTRFFWDPVSSLPWIYVYDFTPFESEVISDESFVQVKGTGVATVVDEPVSLFHTHITGVDQLDIAFFSQEDYITMRHHLRQGQFSLIANVLKGRPDVSPRFHLYGWRNGNIIREGFYIELERGMDDELDGSA
jgi:hypothetical protein